MSAADRVHAPNTPGPGPEQRPATYGVDRAEEALASHYRERYGPRWNDADQAEAERLAGELVRLYELHGVPHDDRMAGV